MADETNETGVAEETETAKVPQLTEEQLEAFRLKCIVCGGQIPVNRARRRKDTCSVEHYEVVKQWRKHLMYSRRCHACHAPYTLRQREEFKEWRRSTGQVQRGAGRPTREATREKRLAQTLVDTTAALRLASNFVRSFLGQDAEEYKLIAGVIELAEKTMLSGRDQLPNGAEGAKDVDTVGLGQDMMAANPT